MPSDCLLVRRDEGILTLTLNRPERRNAIGVELRERLLAALDEATATDVRVVVLRGNGPAFCAGADVAGDKPTPGVPTMGRMRISTQRLVREVIDNPLPVIASVHGSCAGFGVSLALAADFCVAAEDAMFVPAFARVGLAPDGAIAATMTRAVGVVRARRFLMLGEPISGAEAARAELVHSAVPAADLDAATLAIARRLAQSASPAVSAAKSLLSRTLAADLDALLAEERTIQALLTTTPEHREGVQALMERREPRFNAGVPD